MKITKIAAISLATIAMAAAPAAMAQRGYGPQDEGRQFNDGSRVVCRNVEVQRNSRDPNRVAGTATGAVIGGLLGSQIGSVLSSVSASASGAKP